MTNSVSRMLVWCFFLHNFEVSNFAIFLGVATYIYIHIVETNSKLLVAYRYPLQIVYIFQYHNIHIRAHTDTNAGWHDIRFPFSGIGSEFGCVPLVDYINVWIHMHNSFLKYMYNWRSVAGHCWISQMLHVWNIYLHLGYFWGKCR